jgi:hypothetical protein
VHPDIRKACRVDQPLIKARRCEHERAHTAAAQDHLVAKEQTGDGGRVGEQDSPARTEEPVPLA